MAEVDLKMVKVEFIEDAGVEFDKRTYLPLKVSAKCPECGHLCVQDLSQDYLSYPVIGAVVQIGFYHETKPNGPDLDYHEFKVPMKLTVNLEPV